MWYIIWLDCFIQTLQCLHISSTWSGSPVSAPVQPGQEEPGTILRNQVVHVSWRLKSCVSMFTSHYVFSVVHSSFELALYPIVQELFILSGKKTPEKLSSLAPGWGWAEPMWGFALREVFLRSDTSGYKG